METRHIKWTTRAEESSLESTRMRMRLGDRCCGMIGRQIRHTGKADSVDNQQAGRGEIERLGDKPSDHGPVRDLQ